MKEPSTTADCTVRAHTLEGRTANSEKTRPAPQAESDAYGTAQSTHIPTQNFASDSSTCIRIHAFSCLSLHTHRRTYSRIHMWVRFDKRSVRFAAYPSEAILKPLRVVVLSSVNRVCGEATSCSQPPSKRTPSMQAKVCMC